MKMLVIGLIAVMVMFSLACDPTPVPPTPVPPTEIPTEIVDPTSTALPECSNCTLGRKPHNQPKGDDAGNAIESLPDTGGGKPVDQKLIEILFGLSVMVIILVVGWAYLSKGEDTK
jgi:hypothetical protein